jgi:hypothetical protein
MKGTITFSVLFICLLFSALLGAQASHEDKDKKPLPRFEDYPATEVWQGPVARVKIQSHEERLFRTNLRNAVKKPPNFSGHYSLVFWGCGTNCMGGAVVDQKTGNVFQAPLSTKSKGEDHWVLSGFFFFDKPPVNFRSDSRLVIIRSETQGKEDWLDDVYYFVWEDEQFRLILHTIGGRVIGPRSKSS